ncbi:MAG TPA: valine--tRNA ligase [Candidatus Megaira endosymbiont of Nemacystus decipiens]|nr:valine--tRNA ligase [Candidatus Megaera endosymbiont of Nemacystus decipiens]
MIDFPKKYKFAEREKKWQETWQKSGIYEWNPNTSRKQSYVIDTPPPTVSGQLHIGHVFSYTHTDFIARFQRMRGMNVFYPMGFDDNGLPTERLVEKKKKIRANQLGREDFTKICQEVIESEEDKFKSLFDSIALSVDWGIKYRTINPLSTTISQMSFLDLMNKGQVYRDSQPILWDSIDQTALSQADIEEHEKTTFMNDIKFSTEEGETIVIATTRPELLPSCAAIFYHPDDARYKKLKSKFAVTPLFNVRVPILPDDLVDPDKGTGLVMCCTFGDQTDVLWWRKHDLKTKIIFSKHGKIIENIEFDENCLDEVAAKQFACQISGLKISEARKKIIEILRKHELLINQTEKSQLVKCAERSGAPLEILTTTQWFIKSVDHKKALSDKSNQINWHPATMKVKLDSWIENVSLDWCISRQRYFGVPFPVWYSKKPGEEGKILLPKKESLPVDPLKDLPPGYSRDEVEADQDVMDTWSTSSVSPQLNSHGIAKNYMVDSARHEKLFPADLRPQAHEIIRTWAYYTMLKSHLHENTIPWKNIMISGWCLAEDKTKMSKSKGNIVAPEKLIEDFGADVIRYWSSSAKLGSDTAYSEDIMKNGKKFVNKLWNAAKFVSQYFTKMPKGLMNKPLNQLQDLICYDIDKYLITNLSKLVQNVTKSLDGYEYSAAISTTEEFFKQIFCDNYLEIVKTRAYNEQKNDDKGAISAHITLCHSFNIILRLLAPFLPHITEEIYHILYSDGNSIHEKGLWPDLNIQFAEFDENESKALFDVLELVRKAKAKDNLSIKAPVKYIEINQKSFSQNLISDLKDVTSSEEIRFVDKVSSTEQNLLIDKLQINVIY